MGLDSNIICYSNMGGRRHKANTRLEQYDDELNYLIDEMGVRDRVYESDERGRAYQMMCVCGLLLKTVFGVI
ncbi:hypothetical protein MCEMSEM18_03666 [Comamonadaceae bacterium]